MQNRTGSPWLSLEEALPETLAPALLLDEKGSIVAVNPRRARLDPSSEKEISGVSFESLVATADQETVARAIRDCHQAERATRAQTRWARSYPVGDDPQVSFLFCSLGTWTVVLIERRDQVEALQKTLDHRAELLSIHCEIANLANPENGVEEAVECVLRRLARFNGWQYGHAFFWDEDDPDLLVPISVAYAEDCAQNQLFESFTRNSRFRRGEGLPGTVAEEGCPIITGDYHDTRDDSPVDQINELGLRSAFAFPVLVNAEVVGVLEFFSTTTLHNESSIELNSIAAVGLQLGRVVERERSRQARQKSEEHLRLMTRQLRDAVWTYHPRTRRVTYANPALGEIWKMPQEKLIANGEGWLDGILERDRPRARRALQELRDGRVMDEELRVPDRQGTVRWIRLRCFPISDDRIQINSIAATAEDITEEKASRIERARLEKQLRQVTEDERRKIARNLHDDLGGLLSAIGLRVEVLRECMEKDRPPDRKAVETIAKLAREAMATTRRLTRGLAPVGDDPDDLRLALRELVDGIETRSEIDCRLHAEEIHPFPDPETANQLFRIAHEAVTNALKHSGGTLIEVRLSQDQGDLVLSVTDDGCGLNGSKSHGSGGHGLGTMQYRAQDIGADFTTKPGPGGKGLHLSCRLPASAIA